MYFSSPILRPLFCGLGLVSASTVFGLGLVSVSGLLVSNVSDWLSGSSFCLPFVNVLFEVEFCVLRLI